MRHSWLKFPGLLGAFVLVLALAAPAHAVDWSAYIDHSAPARAASTQAPAKTSRAKVGKRGSKKIAKAKSKSKSKAKVKARAKKKPRRK